MPTLVITPVAALALAGLPAMDTTPTPTPVEAELDTVALDGVDSVAAATADMPEAEDSHADHAHEDDATEHSEDDATAHSEDDATAHSEDDATAHSEDDATGHSEFETESATESEIATDTTTEPGTEAETSTEHDESFEVAATSAPLTTDPYRVVAVTWDDEDVQVDELNAWIRYRSDGGWSEWYPLPQSDGHGPDPGSTEAAGQREATEPLVVPESDGVQVRVDTEAGVEVDDLRVDLIDPGESSADATAGTTSAGAAQAAGQPTIFTRADWGADESLRGSRVEYGQIEAAFVHHTVNSNSYSPSDVPAIIRGIYAFHVKSRGYRDIGYNFLIDKWGRIWEGRYGGIDKPVTGAHTYGHNDDAFAASTIGTFTDTEPTQATLDAYARLFAWKLDLHGVDAQAMANLDGSVVNAISGHRDTYATACPGDRLYAKLPQIRAATASLQTGSPTAPSDTSGRLSMSVTLADGRIVSGESTTLAVRTTNVDAGTRVVLKRRVEGRSWKRAQRTTMDASGDLTFTLSPRKPRNYDFRVIIRSDPRLRSALHRVTVVPAGSATTPPPSSPTPTSPTAFAPRGSDVFARPSDGVFDIVGHGWGHGIGMSQWGARQAAAEGVREPDITRTYYPGTTRSRSSNNPVIKVLITADTGSDVIARSETGLSVRWTRSDGATVTRTLPGAPGGCSAPWWRVRATGSDLAIQNLCGQDWRTWRSTAKVDGNRPVTFIPSDGMIDTAQRTGSGFTRKAYRGSIEVHRSASSVRAVNAVPMESYLRSVVPNEMPSSWPTEALRAQAVAARSYAMREMQDRAGYFDVYDTTASQVYPGARLYDGSWRVTRSYEYATTDAAVRATSGVHLRYAGRPALTMFSSSNGGVTAAGNLPYLTRKADRWDAAAVANSRRNWTDSVSAAALERSFSQIGRLERIRVISREGLGDWGGRVLSMRLEGSRGSVTVSGDWRIRSALGTNSSYLTFR